MEGHGTRRQYDCSQERQSHDTRMTLAESFLNWLSNFAQLKDGFIHLSTSQQLPLTLERFFHPGFFPGNELFICAITRSTIAEKGYKLQFDQVSSGEKFGHIYGVSLRNRMGSLSRCR